MEATDPRRSRLRTATIALDIILTVALITDIYVTWGRHRPAAAAPAPGAAAACAR